MYGYKIILEGGCVIVKMIVVMIPTRQIHLAVEHLDHALNQSFDVMMDVAFQEAR